MICVKCGNEFPSLHTINYCPNCGQQIEKENRITKFTSDGKPINQTEGQEDISSKADNIDSESEEAGAVTPKAKGLAKPIKYDTRFINKPSSTRSKAIGALIVIIIISIIIAAVANWFYQQGRETDKLLELGCDPEAWDRFGMVSIWSCPAWRGIDVNDPKTFMDQSPAGPNR